MAVLLNCLVLLSTLYLVDDVYAIKGSVLSPKGQFPFQADLIINFASTDTLYRTGSLISKRFVLTTANNVLGSSKIIAILGVYNVEDKQEPSRRTYVGVGHKVHNRYNKLTGANNIAVIRLNQSAEINEFIQIVPLPRFSYICLPLVDQTARVSGWGEVTPQTPVEYQVLRYADIKIEQHKNCKCAFPNTTYKQLCSTNGTSYFEEADIGAPLVLEKVLVGIAADTSRQNGVVKSPQVYTRIDAHLEWIESQTDITILE